MSNVTRSRVLVVAACIMVAMSVVPLGYVSWFTRFHKFTALSMPILLSQGTYTSPTFTTDLDEMEVAVSGVGVPKPCTAQMDWIECRGPEKMLELDWKIVDARGREVREEHFKDTVFAGYNILLGYYSSKQLSQQQIIVKIQKGIPEYNDAHPVLKIKAHPKYTEFLPEKWIFAMVFVVVGNLFALVLLCLAAFFRRLAVGCVVS